ncbi:DUF4266 domain-containing protein [Chitinophaga japonensis]|uniref:Uncharacterized protein DUF4266 n=1 Tax=Chitinophaga japonensis TaxID=104662 RepID=A0A562T3Z1_CHIJA|nr:DUF4266 domain-containing protein [Chitinophaga japonensis]TWI88083.1 uncharacterized protein DUF4266 [Chitinophaga japonensis]
MQKRNIIRRLLPVIITVLAIQGCATVKPYQRAWLNDDSMQPGRLPAEKFEENAQTYREGGSGGGNGKASGGCGCN